MDVSSNNSIMNRVKALNVKFQGEAHNKHEASALMQGVKQRTDTHSADQYVKFGRKNWCDAMC